MDPYPSTPTRGSGHLNQLLTPPSTLRAQKPRFMLTVRTNQLQGRAFSERAALTIQERRSLKEAQPEEPKIVTEHLQTRQASPKADTPSNLHLIDVRSHGPTSANGSSHTQKVELSMVYTELTKDDFLPAAEEIAVAKHPDWYGEESHGITYYTWLVSVVYEGDLPEIIRRINRFRGFPQLDDPKFNPESWQMWDAHYQSQEGQKEIQSYVKWIEKYQYLEEAEQLDRMLRATPDIESESDEHGQLDEEPSQHGNHSFDAQDAFNDQAFMQPTSPDEAAAQNAMLSAGLIFDQHFGHFTITRIEPATLFTRPTYPKVETSSFIKVESPPTGRLSPMPLWMGNIGEIHTLMPISAPCSLGLPPSPQFTSCSSDTLARACSTLSPPAFTPTSNTEVQGHGNIMDSHIFLGINPRPWQEDFVSREELDRLPNISSLTPVHQIPTWRQFLNRTATVALNDDSGSSSSSSEPDVDHQEKSAHLEPSIFNVYPADVRAGKRKTMTDTSQMTGAEITKHYQRASKRQKKGKRKMKLDDRDYVPSDEEATSAPATREPSTRQRGGTKRGSGRGQRRARGRGHGRPRKNQGRASLRESVQSSDGALVHSAPILALEGHHGNQGGPDMMADDAGTLSQAGVAEPPTEPMPLPEPQGQTVMGSGTADAGYLADAAEAANS